jgi:Leucine-rich repeat (LRR) protein
MPVGRRELERWSQKQQQSNTVSSNATSRVIRDAHTSGTLNLSGKGLDAVPTEILKWYQPIGDENWWDIVALRKLDLSHNAFTSVPHELFLPLSELQTLHMGNNLLEALPPSLACSATLQRINIQRNNFSVLPPAICECLQLVCLNIDHNAIRRLPESLGDLLILETLSASHNQLSNVPESIGNCRALTTVVLASNMLVELPSSLGRVVALTELQLSHNKLERMPESIAQLSLLVRLDCRENKLAQPPTLPRSSRLSEVLFGFNRLQMLPSDIGAAAPSLSVLDVRDNLIADVDIAALLPLKKLKTLDLRNNNIGTLPPPLGTITSISSLLLEGNPLKTMRRTLITATAREILEYLRGRMSEDDWAALAASGGGGLKGGGGGWCADGGLGDEVVAAVRAAMSLDSCLDLRNKGLTVVPEEAAALTSLRSADLSNNKIQVLPAWTQVWGGTLRHLDLSHNLFCREGLQVLGALKSVTTLSVQRNQLRELPEGIAALANLEILDVSQNLLTSLNSLRCSLYLLY